jgi:putative hydrolase of the HAD superfamily
VIKAVFFDLFDTLAHYQPLRQRLYGQVLQEMGIETSPKQLALGIMSGDKYYLDENVHSPVAQRTPQEQGEFYFHYQGLVLARAGIKADKELLLNLMKRLQPLLQELTFVLFDDTIPTLKSLKERGLTTGLLTNATKNIMALQSKLGLDVYLDLIITSQEAGADKPEPPIFLAALKRAGITAVEAVYVGDQYDVDVAGARGAGIKPIMIDRYGLFLDVRDCPRIQSLAELATHL